MNGSARSLTTLYAGQSYTVTGLAASELLSVQGYVSFKYRIEISAAGPTDPPPTNPPAAVPTSEYVIWNCTSSPCDWGQSIGGEALVWPASAGPSSARFELHDLEGRVPAGRHGEPGEDLDRRRRRHALRGHRERLGLLAHDALRRPVLRSGRPARRGELLSVQGYVDASSTASRSATRVRRRRIPRRPIRRRLFRPRSG